MYFLKSIKSIIFLLLLISIIPIVSAEDTIAPTSKAINTLNWQHIETSQLMVTCTDNESGCDKLKLIINGETEQTYNFTFQESGFFSGKYTSLDATITNGGTNNIEYWAIDAAGNEETPHHIDKFKLDLTNPTAYDNATTTTLTKNTTITVTCEDFESGCSILSYCISTNENCEMLSENNIFLHRLQTKTTDISITCEEGEYCEKFLKYKIFDDVANESDVHVVKITINKSEHSAPTNLSAEINESEIILTWEYDTAQIGFKEFLIEKDEGTGLSTVNTTQNKLYNISPLPTATTTYYIKAVNDTGNTSEKVTYTYTPGSETNPPTLTDNAPSDWQNEDVQVTLTCEDASGCKSGSLKYYHGTNSDGPEHISYYAPVAMLYEGEKTVTYYGEDIHGNRSENTFTVKIDKKSPNTPTAYLTVDEDTATVSWSKANDNLSGIKHYKLEQKINGVYTEVKTFSTTDTLKHTLNPKPNELISFRLYAIDNAGNKSIPAIVNHENTQQNLDILLTDNAPTRWQTSDVTITIDCENCDKSTLRYNLGTGEDIFSNTFTISNEGAHNIRYYADNSSGETKFNTVRVLIDKTAPPKPKNLMFVNYSHPSLGLRLNWDNDRDNVSGVRYYDVAEEKENGYFILTNVNSWSYYAFSTLPTKETNFRVYSVDNAGNKSESSYITFSLNETDPPETIINRINDYSNTDKEALVKIQFFCFDQSECEKIHYKIDNEEEQSQFYQSNTTGITISGEGIHNLKFWSTDKSGNIEQPKTEQITIDITPPNITLESSPPLPSNENVTITLSCSDELTGCLFGYYCLSTQPCSPTKYTLLEDNKFTINATCENGYECNYYLSYSISDQAYNERNSTKGTYEFTIDKRNENLITTNTVISPNGSDWTKSDVDFSLSCSMSDSSSCENIYYKIVDASYQKTCDKTKMINSTTGTISCDESDTCAKKVCYYSSSGNNEEPIKESKIFKIDKFSPYVFVTNLKKNQDSLIIEWSKGDDEFYLVGGSGIKEYILEKDEGSGFEQVTQTTKLQYILTPIPTTSTLFKVTAIDNAGNQNEPYNYKFEPDLDINPPTISADYPKDWQNKSTTVTIFCNDQESECRKLNIIKIMIPGTLGIHAFDNPFTVDAEGEIVIELSDEDLSYNRGNAQITVKIDKTPPKKVTVTSANPSADGSVNLSWDQGYDELSGIKQYHVFMRKNGETQSTEIGTTTSTNYKAVNLENGKKYYFSVKAQDVAGNLSETDNELPALIPSETNESTPTLTDNAPSDWQNKNVVINLNCTNCNKSTLEYQLETEPKKTGNKITLTKDGKNYLTYSAESDSGNKVEKTIVVKIDKTKPTAPLKFKAEPTKTNISLKWNSSEDHSSGIKQYIIRYKKLGGTIKEKVSSKTSYTLGNLSPGKYLIDLQAEDFAGNKSNLLGDLSVQIEDDKKNTTSNFLTPPTPNGLTVNLIDNSAEVTWVTIKNSTDRKLKYHIFRDGKEIGSTDQAKFTDKTIEPGENYNYYVTAEGINGIFSEKSERAIFIADEKFNRNIFNITQVSTNEENISSPNLKTTNKPTRELKALVINPSKPNKIYNYGQKLNISVRITLNDKPVLVDTVSAVVSGNKFNLEFDNSSKNYTGDIRLPEKSDELKNAVIEIEAFMEKSTYYAEIKKSIKIELTDKINLNIVSINENEIEFSAKNNDGTLVEDKEMKLDLLLDEQNYEVDAFQEKESGTFTIKLNENMKTNAESVKIEASESFSGTTAAKRNILPPLALPIIFLGVVILILLGYIATNITKIIR